MPVDIRKPLKKFLPHLLQAQADNLNEADTVQRISKVFEDILGYDPLTEITFEAQMKNKYVDMALKVDGTIKLLLEAKAAGVTLRDRHIEQAQMYASRNNYQWVLLTNGICWNLYHLTFEEGIEYERAFTVDLSKDDFDQAAQLLALLHRQSVRRGEHEDYWARKRVLSPASIGRALFTEEMLRALRREVRRQEGLLIDVEDLGNALHGMFSAEARELMGPMRIKRRRARREPAETASEAPSPTSAAKTTPA